ncbi:MAG: hypothetical protein DWI21_11740 [Planctomycetota bacterium]|nr:MAG: hypothetical protein DWI21_11740 [Planctomycetota bacterium]GDY10743.1 hypothetical protein LBMAG52_42310 [Planctomycetia bacterium]
MLKTLLPRILAFASLLTAMPSSTPAQALLPGFQKSLPFNEQVKWSRLESGVRVLVNAPAELTDKPRVLVIFATPNGNTIEQTLGCAAAKGLDWRFDIQHVAAQIRRLRELDREREIVLAAVQAPKLSWPTFRREQAGANTIIRDLVATLAKEVSAEQVVLTCHSGGGSFIFGELNAAEALPTSVERIVFLDANYSYSDDEGHGDKLLAWLNGDAIRRLVVVAYDDRELTLNGKKVVGHDGGTFRASQRMLNRFRHDVELTERDVGPFKQTAGLNGQIQFFVHPNPDNKILHSVLVGEMNGLLHGLTLGTDLADKWGTFGGPRAYSKWIQPQPFVDPSIVRAVIAADAPEVRLAIPARPANAPTGSRFLQQITNLPRDQREAAILRELLSGNVPDSLRHLKPIRVHATDDSGVKHIATYFVMADYLAVGIDGDFFRVPITPATAAAIAEKCDASLITAKVSDDVFAAAELKLDPKPLTKDRDSAGTFWQHHQIIEEQLRNKPRGLLVAGIKKDVVLTNRLKEKPHKVAIYGWHESNGRPIQPVYVGHVDWYVDYSHGVRLMSQQMIVDDRPLKVADVLKDSRLCPLLSTEGPMDVAELRQAAGWGR